MKSNLYMFDHAFEAGLRQITNSVRPIRVPSDLRGLKLRANAAPMEVATFKAFGANPTVIDGSQLYVAVQTHIVDGTDLGLTIFEAYKLYEVQKYVSMVNHSWSGYPIVANPAAWQRLPANLRAIVDRNVNAAALLERADMQRQEATTRASLESKGMITNDADIPAFKAAVKAAGLYPEWRSQFGAEMFELLEKSVGKLA
jgi:TRAP-type C4-dicarboxylate transport system substrate-binding protein